MTDWFHLDDCGGYNPPCRCGRCSGEICRSCCEAQHMADEEDERIEPFSDAEYTGL